MSACRARTTQPTLPCTLVCTAVTTACSCCLLRLRVSRHKLFKGLAACIGRCAIMARKKNASRKAAQHGAARDISKASKTPPVTIQSLPPDLISRILFLTGRPAAFANVCRCHDTCKGKERSCIWCAVRRHSEHANGQAQMVSDSGSRCHAGRGTTLCVTAAAAAPCGNMCADMPLTACQPSMCMADCDLLHCSTYCCNHKQQGPCLLLIACCYRWTCTAATDQALSMWRRTATTCASGWRSV